MAIDNAELCKHLISLAQLDIDAIHAYSHAIERINIESVKENLTRFREDHERHVQLLSPVISELGGTPPEFKPDFKGFVIQGMTALRSVTGNEGALKAMRTNEELTNRTYEKALGWEMPADVRAIIEKNREDERRHLDYVNQAIEGRIWEKQKAA